MEKVKCDVCDKLYSAKTIATHKKTVHSYSETCDENKSTVDDFIQLLERLLNDTPVGLYEKHIYGLFSAIGTKVKSNVKIPPKGIYYIEQPNGTQQSPDMFVYVDGRRFKIEIKSRKTIGSPTWNSGLPDPGTIYVFHISVPKKQHTYIMMGGNLITPEERKILVEVRARIDSLIKTYSFGDRWSLYGRPMHNQLPKVYVRENIEPWFSEVKTFIKSHWDTETCLVQTETKHHS
jgi:hypothetical protein